jgi:hypothetical protein
MSVRFYELHGIRIVELMTEETPLRSDRDAVDVIAMASTHRPEIIVIRVKSLGDGFFRLKTRIAGEVIQKFLTYGLRLVIIGDVATYAQNSSAFRDFVYECNRGSHVWFVAGIEELDERLQSQTKAP